MFSQSNSAPKKGFTPRTSVEDVMDLVVEFDLLGSEEDFNVITTILQGHLDRYNLKLALINLHSSGSLSRRVFDQLIHDSAPSQIANTLISQSIDAQTIVDAENARFRDQIIQFLTDSNLLSDEKVFKWATDVVKQHRNPQDLYHVLIITTPAGLALHFQEILLTADPQNAILDIQHRINEEKRFPILFSKTRRPAELARTQVMNEAKDEGISSSETRRPAEVARAKAMNEAKGEGISPSETRRLTELAAKLARAVDENDLPKIIEARLEALPEHATTKRNNLKSPMIQELVAQHKLTIDEAESLSLLQRKNLESPTIRQLIASNQLLFKQAMSLSADQRKSHENKGPKK